MNPVRAMYDALNRNDVNGIVDQFTEKAELIDVPSNSVVRGRTMLADYFHNWLDAFSESHGEITSLVEKDDIVVAEATGTGTLQGAFSTPYGTLTTPGRKIEVKFCQIYRVQNGKIVSARTYYDMARIMVAASGAERPAAQAA